MSKWSQQSKSMGHEAPGCDDEFGVHSWPALLQWWMMEHQVVMLAVVTVVVVGEDARAVTEREQVQ